MIFKNNSQYISLFKASSSAVVFVFALFFTQAMFFLPLFFLVSNLFFSHVLWKKYPGERKISFFVISLFFDLLVWAAFFFLPGFFLFFVLIISHSIIQFLFWHTEQLFRTQDERYQPYSRENIGNYLSVLLYYLISLIAISGNVVLGIPMWIILLFWSGVVFVIVFYQLRLHALSEGISLFFSLFIIILGVEFLWVSQFLPISLYIIALNLTLILYFSINIFRFYALGKLNRQIWIRYIFLSFSISFLTLITARWI